MAIEYCNLTTDLTRVYRDIESYKNLETLTGFEQIGATAVYKLDQSGVVEMVFENGVEMTDGGDTSPAAGEYYYDAASDTLYIQTSGSDAPTGYTIQAGLDWNVFKQACRNDAQEMVEAWLKSVYATPFQKIVAPGQSYNSRDYDYIIRRITALMTCYLIISQTNTEDPAAEKLYKQVFHEPNFEGEQPGIVQQILEGKLTLRTQLAAREAGGFNVYENPNNATTAHVIVSGRFTGYQKEVWRLQIDTLGAPGTATYKISRDQGSTFDYTLQETRKTDSDDRRINIADNIYVEFVGTFAEGDYWDIELFPVTDRPTVQAYGALKLSRN